MVCNVLYTPVPEGPYPRSLDALHLGQVVAGQALVRLGLLALDMTVSCPSSQVEVTDDWGMD